MSDTLRILGLALLAVCPGALSAAEPGLHGQLTLKEGFWFKARLAVETRCLTELFTGERIDSRRETAIEFLCRVAERHSDGCLRIEFKYEQIHDTSFYEAGCDPTRPNAWHADGSVWTTYRSDGHDPTFRAHALSALVGQSFDAEIAPDGHVRSVQGLEDVQRYLRDALAYRPIPTSDSGRIRIDPNWRKEWEKKLAQERQDEIGRFFASYWPLSEQSMRESIQELLLVWPQAALDTGVSWHTEDALSGRALRRTNSWIVKDKCADGIIVQLVSDVCTDLNLCDPAVAGAEPWQSSNFVDAACSWYRGAKFAPMYAGARTGLFTVDPRSGLICAATWNQELTGIVPLKDPSRGKPEPLACLSKHTQAVSIQLTPQEDKGSSEASK